MKKKPLPKNAGIFSGGLGFKIAQRSATFSILTLAAFFIGYSVQIVPDIIPCREVGISMAFIVLSWASVINIFNIRSEKSAFKTGFLSNKGIFFSVLFSIGFTAFVALTPPVAAVFSVVPLSIYHWLIIIGLASLQLFSVEIQKLIVNRK